MRILDIAMWMLIFNAMLGFFGNMYNSSVPTTEIEVNASIPGWNQTTMNMTEPQFNVWQWTTTIMGAWNALYNILMAAFAIGFYLQHLFPFVPSELATILTTIVDAIYLIGLVQWIRGVSTEGMQ